MKSTRLLSLAVLTLMFGGAPATQAETPVVTLQAQFQALGAGPFSADAGKVAWTRDVTTRGKAQSCASCHGSDLTKDGRHTQTQKPIAAMAPSVNPKRLSNVKKVEKWLLRNCKGTWGRECTPQEKGDFLAYLGSL